MGQPLSVYPEPASIQAMSDAEVRQHNRQARMALLCTLVMLAGSAALAGALAANRRSVRLGDPLTPATWDVSFRPPMGWSHRQRLEGPSDMVIEYRDPSPSGRRRTIWVRFSPEPHAGAPGEYATYRWRAQVQRTLSIGGRQPGFTTAKAAVRHPLGQLPGSRIEDITSGVIVQIGFDGRVAYSVELTAFPPLSRNDRQLLNRVADSFEHVRSVR